MGKYVSFRVCNNDCSALQILSRAVTPMICYRTRGMVSPTPPSVPHRIGVADRVPAQVASALRDGRQTQTSGRIGFRLICFRCEWYYQLEQQVLLAGHLSDYLPFQAVMMVSTGTQSRRTEQRSCFRATQYMTPL